MERSHDPVRRLYGLDIETDTTLDGLDPLLAAVVAVAVSDHDGDVVLLGDEADVLRRLDAHLRSLEPGTLVTWNGSGFDLPFLAQRARLHGLTLGLRMWPDPFAEPDAQAHTDAQTPSEGQAQPCWPPPPGGVRASWGAHGHLDGYRLFRADVRRSTGLSCGLKSLARLVGLDPVEVDVESLHTLSADVVSSYVASDARLARQLVLRRMPAAARCIDSVPDPTGPPCPVATVPLAERA